MSPQPVHLLSSPDTQCKIDYARYQHAEEDGLTCAKAHVVGVDEAACIALPIYNPEVHSVIASTLRVHFQIWIWVAWLYSGSLHMHISDVAVGRIDQGLVRGVGMGICVRSAAHMGLLHSHT